MDDTPLRPGDAFGQSLIDCLDAGVPYGQIVHTVERDDGHREFTDTAEYFREAWSPRDRWAMRRARGRVLDIGCGAGPHSLHLQQAGHDVVALDPSPGCIEVCRRRGVKTAFLGTVHDLASENPQPFDTFLFLGNNLGVLASADEARRTLTALAGMASPEAIVLGENLDPYRTARPEHLRYHERNRSLGRMPGQVSLRVTYNGLAGEWFDYLFASKDELDTLIAATPWTLAEFAMGADAGFDEVLYSARLELNR